MTPQRAGSQFGSIIASIGDGADAVGSVLAVLYASVTEHVQVSAYPYACKPKDHPGRLRAAALRAAQGR